MRHPDGEKASEQVIRFDEILAETLQELRRVREAAWLAWEASRQASAGADPDDPEPIGNATFLRMVLTCLDRQSQLLDLKSQVKSNPDLVNRVVERLSSEEAATGAAALKSAALKPAVPDERLADSEANPSAESATPAAGPAAPTRKPAAVASMPANEADARATDNKATDDAPAADFKPPVAEPTRPMPQPQASRPATPARPGTPTRPGKLSRSQRRKLATR